MKNKKLCALLLCGAMTAVMAAGCSSGSGGETSEGTDDGEEIRTIKMAGGVYGTGRSV